MQYVCNWKYVSRRMDGWMGGWINITAFTWISSTAFEIEALSFAVNRFRKKTNAGTLRTQIKCVVENFKPGRNPVSYRKPLFCKRRVKVKNSRELKRYVSQNISSNSSEALWTSIILNSIRNSLFYSLQRSRALNFIVDSFQTNNTLIYSHGLLYLVINTYFGSKFSYWSPLSRVALHAQLFDTVNVKYQQSK